MQVFIERKINICIIISFDILMLRFCIYCMMYLILYNSWINMEVCFSNRKCLCYFVPLYGFSVWTCYYVKAKSIFKSLVRPKNILDLHGSSNTWWSQLICVRQGTLWPVLTLLYLCPKNSQPNSKIHRHKYHSMKRLWRLIFTKIEVTVLHIYRWKLYVFHNISPF